MAVPCEGRAYGCGGAWPPPGPSTGAREPSRRGPLFWVLTVGVVFLVILFGGIVLTGYIAGNKFEPIEALRAMVRVDKDNEILEEDLKSLKERETSEGKFAGMPDDQIREYIKTNTGRGVVGQPNRKTLVRMAQDSEPKGNAA